MQENKKRNEYLKNDLWFFIKDNKIDYLEQKLPVTDYSYCFVGILNKDKTKVKNIITGEIYPYNVVIINGSFVGIPLSELKLEPYGKDIELYFETSDYDDCYSGYRVFYKNVNNKKDYLPLFLVDNMMDNFKTMLVSDPNTSFWLEYIEKAVCSICSHINLMGERYSKVKSQYKAFNQQIKNMPNDYKLTDKERTF